MDARCRIQLLGGLRVRQGDRTITRFRTQKTGALLGYLAYHLDRGHPREVLAELLWPGAAPPAGRRSLKVALSSLRRQLEPPGIPAGAIVQGDRSAVRLNPDAVSTDVARFEAALAAAHQASSQAERTQHLMDAVSTYGGPLLPGYYQDWIMPEQERLAELHYGAARRLAAALQASGELEVALDYARRAVAADPLREEGQRDLMRLLVAAGRPETALRQYEDLERVLRDELGTAPSMATRQLIARLGRPGNEEPPFPDETVAPTQVHLASRPPSLPTGVLTFLLTDVEDSTLLRKQNPDAFERALEVHYALLRSAVRRHGGHEVKESGDGLVVVFEHATDALACSVECQTSHAGKMSPQAIGQLRVRMALHTGEVELVDREYRGPAIHHASRVLTAGHGGQILCSESSAVLLRERLEPPARLVDLGTYRLGGVHFPERLFQVDYPEMEPQEFPPLTAEPGYGGRVPLTFTRFFGRQAELAWLRETLLREGTRVVTMIGPGGSGKTRLALEAAGYLMEAFGGAVWFVPLQELTDAALIAGTITDVLHLPRSPHVEPLAQAVEHLSRQPSLLILDNFEHVIEEGVRVVRILLERAPTLRCLVTSRQRVNLSGEHELAVGPLPTPGPQDIPDSLMRCESVQLFVDRAQAALPDFQVTASNAGAVADLCDRLEGIPLALELAAARAQVLTPTQMLAQLKQRFGFLVSRKRDTPDRHRTLRAAFDWSYRMLGPEMQRFFARLSVFRGGWTVDAAEVVCEEPRALEYLQQLCECSLVLPVTDMEQAGEKRFRLLETLREYARERLPGTAWGALRQRHAEYYLALAEEAGQKAMGEEQAMWLERLAGEHENLRAAFEESQGEARLRLAGALSDFWWIRGELSEGRAWLESALQEGAAASTAVRAKALCAAGRLAWGQGDFGGAATLLEDGLAACREVGDPVALAFSLDLLGVTATAFGDHERAEALLEESLALYREADDRLGALKVLADLGYVALRRGDHERARAMYQEELSLAREVQAKSEIAHALRDLGAVAAGEGDYAQAVPLAEESLALAREIGDTRGIADSLYLLAHVALSQGDNQVACRLLEESLATYEAMGERKGLAFSLAGLAMVEWAEGKPARAVRLYGAAEALLEALCVPQPPEREELRAMRAALGEAVSAAARAEGRSMTPAHAVAYALRRSGGNGCGSPGSPD